MFDMFLTLTARGKILRLVLGAWCACLLVFDRSGLAEDHGVIADRLRREVQKVRSGTLAVAVVDLDSGRAVFGSNDQAAVKPASILKLPLAALALDRLGANYRFTTELLTEPTQARPDLYVRAGADPSMTNESLWMMARALSRLGGSYRDIVLDLSRARGGFKREGARAYQTGSSALPLNFNAYTFHVCPQTPGRSARVIVDPWESAVTTQGVISSRRSSGSAYYVDEVRGVDRAYRLRGHIGPRPDCAQVFRSVADPPRYFGTVFKSFLDSVGVSVSGRVRHGETPKAAKLLYQHQSKPLSLVIRDLNHFSNNFTANQVLYALGEDKQGVMDWQVGLDRFNAYIQRFAEGDSSNQVFDGSGLSHSNRVSVRAIARILLELFRNPHNGPEFVASLPVGGRSGTLKKRSFGVGSVVVRAKTGTLAGVSSLAGYVLKAGSGSYGFVIVLNGSFSKDYATSIENRIVQALARTER